MAEVIGASLVLDGEQANATVKSFKAQLREAQNELVNITEKFGSTSAEAANAAKKVANLKDSIGDANSLVAAFNPDRKFVAFGQAVQGVTGGFAALQGAMGLIGVESENVQKQLLKVQSALALTQGLDSIRDSIQGFKNLGSILVNTLGKGGLIGIAAAGVGVLTLAISGVFKKTEDFNAELEATKEITKKASESFGKAKVEVASMADKIKLAKQGFLDKKEVLKEYNEGIGRTIGATNDLVKAEALIIEKGPAYIQLLNLKAKANAAAALAEESARKTLLDEQKNAKDFVGFFERIFTNDPEKQRLEAKAKALKKDEETTQLYFKKMQDLQTEAAAFAKANQLNFTPTSLTTTASKPDIDKEAEERRKLLRQRNEEDAKELLKQIHRQADAEREIAITTTEIKQTEAQKQLSTEFARTNAEQQESDRRKRIAAEEAEEKIKYAEAEAASKIALAQQVANALGGLSELVGKQTAAGKVLALAEIAANTAIGFIQGLDIAQKSAKATGPAAVFAFPIFYAAQVAAVLGAAAKAKAILKSGGSGSSSPASSSTPNTSSVSAPLAPRTPQTGSTTLDQTALNNQGNAAVRAFVLAEDVNNNQERLIRLNRAARLGG